MCAVHLNLCLQFIIIVVIWYCKVVIENQQFQMKITPAIFLLTTLIYLAGCHNISKSCKHPSELKNSGHLANIRDLKAAPELLDTLSKYSQLQVFKIINDEYTIGMHCHVFYKGYKIFLEDYRLFKRKVDNSINSMDNIPTAIDVSTNPTIDYKGAIEIAKKTLDFGQTCIGYSLGFYNINSGISFQPKSYKLVWMVQNEDPNGYPRVLLDAHTGVVYIKDNGVRY